MTLRPKLLFVLVLVQAFWPLLLGALLAPPTDCSMPTPAPVAMTTVASSTVSTTWEAPPTTLKASPIVPTPTVTSTWEAPPTQSLDPIVEEEPCEVDVDDVPLLT